MTVRGVSFTYGVRQSPSVAPVLDCIQSVIPSGQIVGILGPNGSGKSTFLKLLAGLLKPRKGVISLFGDSLEQLSAREVAKRVAF
ncbi:MAG: ABC transporter ATP-binding protein, partial [Nitrospira sp.]|nr:ABC transporter ATP-binding protein [Nitrospira sp.]